MSGRQDEDLKRAIGELRAFAKEVPPQAIATRARVLAEKAPPKRARGWLLAFALLALGGPAFAQVSGLWPEVVATLRAWTGGQGERARQVRAPRRSKVELKPELVKPPGEAPAAAPAAIEVPAIAAPEPARAPRAKRAPLETVGAAERRAAEREHARALYLEAHRTHFEGGEPARALEAWDAFLRAAPNDAFAPEARYNRAILLVKLARDAQAIEALAPFACAADGAYRQREARALIARVRLRAPGLEPPACLSGVP